MGTKLEENGSTAETTLRSELMQRCNTLWEEVLCSLPSTKSSELWTEHERIRFELQYIADLQKAIAPSQLDDNVKQDREVAISKLMEWSDHMGIKHDGVKVVRCVDGTGFGLQATDNIQNDSVVISVPRKAILSWDLARKSHMLKRCFEKDVIVRTMDNVALALMVCCQKLMPDSGWLPYLESLPTSFTTPLYFTKEQIKDLCPSPAYEESMLMYRNVARQFIYFLVAVQCSEESRNSNKMKINASFGVEPLFVNAPFTVSNFTFDMYRWAVASVTTRINMIPSQEAVDGTGKPISVPCLIPVLDFANHEMRLENDSLSMDYSIEDEMACVRASRDYSPGDAVKIFYGIRNSRQFMLHNGFVPDQINQFDTYKLRIGFPKDDKQIQARVELMRIVGFNSDSRVYVFEVKNSATKAIPEELLDFAMVFLVENPASVRLEELRNDREMQYKAWKFLKDRFTLLKRGYGVKKMGDEAGDEARDEAGESVEVMIKRLKENEIQVINEAEQCCADHCKAAELRGFREKSQ